MANRYKPTPSPATQAPTLENNFTQGLKTEYTGLNFPENACVATNNCTFLRTGQVTRRNGMDYESGFTTQTINRSNSAISTFLWENAGGDGNSVILVVQVGLTLSFFLSTNATISAPLSTTKLGSIVNLASTNPAIECTYSSGNGYLFVFNPTQDPLYCTFSGGVVNSFAIPIQIRDFAGIPEAIADNNRPAGLSNEHLYNLQNQGWTQGAAWVASSNTFLINSTTPATFTLGNNSFAVAAGITGISNGQAVVISGNLHSNLSGANYPVSASGIVSGYSGGTLTINITSSTSNNIGPAQGFPSVWTENWTITPGSTGYISTWASAVGNYPSNADQWWQFKNASDVFAPATTVNNVTLATGPAPKGSYIMPAFTQQRSAVSGVGGLTEVSTVARPKAGAWYQGRIFYSGVDSSFQASGDEPFSTWTENIYFSQIVQNTNQFGRCYQTNDPTSETLFSILPSDGGVIVIQGSGSIYKLFPVLNGLLVFAANGIWYITGSQGIGFTATDYTVSKISGEHAISSTSFVDVQGWPFFWNAEGIYSVSPGQQGGGLQVQDMVLPTIKQFYNNIPLSSKKLARGSYNHITGQIQWLYKSTQSTSTTDAYTFDTILNFLTYTGAFYPWTISSGSTIHGIKYVEGPGGLNVPPPLFKYLTSTPSGGTYNFTFSEERNSTTFTDWPSSGTPQNFVSSFQTGYKLHGQAQRKWQPEYIYVYSELPAYGYKIQGLWDYAVSPLTGRWSTIQVVKTNVSSTKFSKWFKRHRIRGHGYVLQFSIASVDGQPFSISGWSVVEQQNMMA